MNVCTCTQAYTQTHHREEEEEEVSNATKPNDQNPKAKESLADNIGHRHTVLQNLPSADPLLLLLVCQCPPAKTLRFTQCWVRRQHEQQFPYTCTYCHTYKCSVTHLPILLCTDRSQLSVCFQLYDVTNCSRGERTTSWLVVDVWTVLQNMLLGIRPTQKNLQQLVECWTTLACEQQPL